MQVLMRSCVGSCYEKLWGYKWMKCVCAAGYNWSMQVVMRSCVGSCNVIMIMAHLLLVGNVYSKFDVFNFFFIY